MSNQMYDNYHKSPLPVTKKEAEKRGWSHLDIVIVSGDAYVDHPSFGTAVIGRLLENMGYKVGIVPQPNWQDDLRDFKKFGKPRLFFGVTSGCMDSMVNHYTAHKRLRSNDAYTPGDKHGFRPDYATSVYSSILKELFPDTPVILGGIEASLRRFTHYDYWSDTLKPSILIDSKADMLIYGMGEKPIREVALRIDAGESIKSITDVAQTAFVATGSIDNPKHWDEHTLFSYANCKQDKVKFAKNFTVIETESNKLVQKRLIQENEGKTVIVNPAYLPGTQEEIDEIYALPYTRKPHFKYNKKGSIPAFEMIRNSVNIHRGCFGGCSFCTISAHQGKFIVSRSEGSVMEEIEQIISQPDFKGHITDIGGPSANMYKMKGNDLSICEKCTRPSCIFPRVCKNLNTDHTPMNKLYKKVLNLNGVKKVTIGSGIRYDLFDDNNGSRKYIQNLIEHHVSGRLKVAPEHTLGSVLKIMRKPDFELFKKFKIMFESLNKKIGLKQQIIPYFISSHPGCREEDMRALSHEIKQQNIRPEQVQDFTPTPMTLSTVMYYTGLNPYTLEPVFVARTRDEKQRQKELFFWYKKPERNDGGKASTSFKVKKHKKPHRKN